MPDTKISELPTAAPLTGAETVPVVQDGATVQATTLDLARLVAASEVETLTASGTVSIPRGIVRLEHAFDSVDARLPDTALVGDQVLVINSTEGLSLAAHTATLPLYHSFLHGPENRVTLATAGQAVLLAFVGSVMGQPRWAVLANLGGASFEAAD